MDDKYTIIKSMTTAVVEAGMVDGVARYKEVEQELPDDEKVVQIDSTQPITTTTSIADLKRQYAGYTHHINMLKGEANAVVDKINTLVAQLGLSVTDVPQKLT